MKVDLIDDNVEHAVTLNPAKNILKKQDHIEKDEDDSICFDVLEPPYSSSTSSTDSVTSSSDALLENISDSYKIGSEENVDTIVKAVLAQSSNDGVTKKLCLPKSGLYKNHSVSVEDIMLLRPKINVIPPQIINRKTRLSLNDASIKHGVSFSAPNSPQGINKDCDTNNEPKFQRLLHHIGLLHTAPVTNKDFDFTRRRHSSKNNQEYSLTNSLRFSNVRRSFQLGLSHIKKPEMKQGSLIGTAMQTILMDKINIMSEILDENLLDKDSKNVEFNASKEFKCYDRPEPRETVLGTPFMSLADLTQTCLDLQKKSNTSLQCLKEETPEEFSIKPQVERQRSFSLFDTAMETILIDKVNALMLTSHSTLPSEENDLSISNFTSNLLKSSSKALQENIDSHVMSDDIESYLLDTNQSLHDIPMFSDSCSDRIGSSPVHKQQQGANHQRTESVGNKTAQSPIKHSHGLNINSSHRRSSDSDLSITPKGNINLSNTFILE